MSEKKIIAVMGATGNQGGALVDAILENGPSNEFEIRAIIRDETCPKAIELKKRGVNVVIADVFNEQALQQAVTGCYGMFCVTIKDHFSTDKETVQGMNMAKAAKKAGIKHVIWSTLEDTRKILPKNTTVPTLQGKYKVPHFDSRADADFYFTDLPTTYLLKSFYYENFIESPSMRPQKFPDGKLYLELPMGNKIMPMISSIDIGKCALAIFKNPIEYIHRRIGLVGCHLTMAEVAEKMSKTMGVEIGYKTISCDSYRELDLPGTDDIANMFQFIQDCNDEFNKARKVEECRRLNKDLMDFDMWLMKNSSKIPIH